MVGRIDRASYGSVRESRHNRPWDHEGQLNIVAFSTLLRNPDADLAEVAWRWADEYFGPAHPYALKALEQGAGIFHDIFYVYPGEDLRSHWRGRWLEPRMMMDDRYGVFGALREAGGYRTPKELALVRCERILADLVYGERVLTRCTDEQVRRYRVLQEKFRRLLVDGRRRLDLLSVYSAFADLFFQGYSVGKHRERFLQAVDRFRDRYGKDTRADEIGAMFRMLEACDKLDVNTYGGYCAAGEV